jgi:hypothetical protein
MSERKKERKKEIGFKESHFESFKKFKSQTKLNSAHVK